MKMASSLVLVIFAIYIGAIVLADCFKVKIEMSHLLTGIMLGLLTIALSIARLSGDE